MAIGTLRLLAGGGVCSKHRTCFKAKQPARPGEPSKPRNDIPMAQKIRYRASCEA